ncbi:MAG: class I SAM-dependent methyltransferase, partial [Deltaproteobacteria bacterium]
MIISGEDNFIKSISTREFFRYAKERKIYRKYQLPLIKYTANLLNPYIQGTVLDIGCGRSNYIFESTSDHSASKTVGIDLSKDSLNNNPWITIKIVGDAQYLPCRRETIDCAMMLDIAEHLRNPK